MATSREISRFFVRRAFKEFKANFHRDYLGVPCNHDHLEDLSTDELERIAARAKELESAYEERLLPDCDLKAHYELGQAGIPDFIHKEGRV